MNDESQLLDFIKIYILWVEKVRSNTTQSYTKMKKLGLLNMN